MINETGEARLTDIAENMSVTQPTASKIIQRLKREGLVQNKPYRSIFLTREGAAMAKEARRRHELVFDFLIALGVDENVADADAEGMEHHVSDSTLELLTRLTGKLREAGTPFKP